MWSWYHKMAEIWLVILMFAVSSAFAEIETEFTRWPESVTAPVGDRVTFECAVGVPGERLVWRRKVASTAAAGDWVEVPGTANETVSTKLPITIDEHTQSAFYQCVVWYGAVMLASVPARLTIARIDLSANSQQKRVITAPLHNVVSLHCKEPVSEPPAILTWWKEEQGSKKQLETPHGVLILRNVTIEDSGTYGCRATNELSGQVVELPEKTLLKVQRESHSEARFLEEDSYVGTVEGEGEGVLSRSLRAGEALRLWCGAVGAPPPRVQWAREHGRLSARARVEGQQLVLSPFRLEDEGIYSCTANGIRRAWSVVQLQEPSWEGAASGVNASEGRGARVQCGRARGTPPPAVHWLLNARPLRPERGVSTTDSELYLDRVEKRHAGIVQCFACNVLGCAYDTALLTVVPQQISDQEYAGEGSKAFHTSARPPRGHHRSKNIRRKPVLVPPSRPNVTRMSDESVMVTWSNANHGLPIQFFKVQYKEATNNTNGPWQTTNDDIKPYTHSYLVDGLIPDRYYRFRIAAVYSNQDNKLGKSSAKFYLQRGGYHSPQAPVLTKAEAVSPTQIMLNWTWSSGAGGSGVQCAGFYVHYRAVTSAGKYAQLPAAATARAALVPHLAPDLAYELKLQAYTAQAPSDFSAILVAKTHRLPVSPGGGGSGAGSTPGGASTATPPRDADEARRPGALVTAGCALGAAALLLALAAMVLRCRRARRPDTPKEKNSHADSTPANGYIPAKVPITITANPMHSEQGGDSSVEMSYLHNNNCGNAGSGDDTLPHPRKNGPAPRNYV